MTKKNLLIVDDEPTLLKLLKINLREHVDHVFSALNGVEALNILNSEEIHCVVCDINMPELNGMEVIKRIRAENNDVPFIFFSGHGHEEQMKEAAKYGAYEFITKPMFEKLEEFVEQGFREGFVANTGEITQYKKILMNYQEHSS